MKNFKRITGIALVLIMVLGMAMTVFAAADTGSRNDCTITINNAQKGETYNAYKMMDLYVNEGLTAFSYKVNTAWTDFFTTGAGKDYVTIDSQGYVKWKTGMDAEDKMVDFGKAAAKFAADNSIAATKTDTPENDGTVTFSNLESGYYLVTSTNGTLAIVDTTPANPDFVMNEKNADPTITKKVQEDDDTDAWGSTNTAQIGDTVNFKVTINAKKGAKDYVLHETMDNGLTVALNTIAINDGTKDLVKDTDYTVVNSGLTDGDTFEIVFDQDYLDTIDGDTTITVTYSAELNQNAADLAGENNTAKLTWGDNSSVEETTTTYTYKFAVHKYANDATDVNLAGAVFELRKGGTVVPLIKVTDTEYRVADSAEQLAADVDSGYTTTFTTVDSGDIVIKGVDTDADYTLVEISAPAGFNTLEFPVELKNEDGTTKITTDNTLVVDVQNLSGTELPSTGGIGTTIFYIVGSCLVLGAAVLLITKKRMSKNN
ncbi:MAG: SpaH/EbpB family LPXTG-anchored major pilin [Ruminococcus sp.]